MIKIPDDSQHPQISSNQKPEFVLDTKDYIKQQTLTVTKNQRDLPPQPLQCIAEP